MSDYKIRAFKDDFNFHQDELPESLLFKFGDQLLRARKVLLSRSQKDILHAIDNLDWMLFQGEELEVINTFQEFEEGGVELFAHRVKALKFLKNSEQVDLSEEKHLPNMTWSEYFAVLTLVYITEYLYFYQLATNSQTAISEIDNLDILEWALEAMDSICTAECYQEDVNSPEIVEKSLLSEYGKKGRKIQLQPKNDLKEKVLESYRNKHQNRTNRSAAHKIYEELKDEIDDVLNTDDPVKRLEKWIGPYKKQLKT